MLSKIAQLQQHNKTQIQKIPLQRYLSCGRAYCKNTGSRSRWIKRHLSDPYVKNAARDNYRCRSAYKLLELNNKFQFLQPGKIVIDCGASPGSWTQVAVQKVHSLTGTKSTSHGIVIGIDLLDIQGIPGAVLLGGHDFTVSQTQDKVLSLLHGKKPDIIMSDMAPNSSGNHALDHDAIVELSESVYHFAIDTLSNGGVFLCKLWDGKSTQDFMNTIQDHFKRVKKHKPQASRKDSSEIYIYADGLIQEKDSQTHKT